MTKKKTFLFYLSNASIFFKLSFSLKFLCLTVLSSLAILNHLHIINWLIGLAVVTFLVKIGFLRSGLGYFKLILYSLTVFSAIWLLFSKVPGDIEYFKYPWGSFLTNKTIEYVLLATSKWFLLCSSGLLFLATSSQEELVEDLIHYQLPHEIILITTIGFNTVTFILESLFDINISLESRDISGNSNHPNPFRIVYISCAVIMCNIKRITMLRIAYYLDIIDIQRLYGKRS